MRRCVQWYLPTGKARVVDLGAMNVNGSYRELLPSTMDYVGVDLEPGPGVDVVLTDVYRLPFEDGSVDVVLSGQMLEHCGQFWRIFSEIHRVLKPDGLAFLIAPSSGPVHRYPVDCYRFFVDSFAALADWSGLRLVHAWTDERGPWRDVVGVFQKGAGLQPVTAPFPMEVAANARQEAHSDPAVEVQAGARPYLDVLRDLHALVDPGLYLEIGVRRGASLALAACPAIAVDPDPHPDFGIANEAVKFYRCTSDDFFFFFGGQAVCAPVDLAFIDGMHLAEYVYRDFMNIERVMSPGGVVVIDDIMPNHPIQASRERLSQVWTGDVWRFADRLAIERPDLRLTRLDTAPTGLLIISGLDPKNRVLWNDYNPKMRRLSDEAGTPAPDHVIARRDALPPTLETLRMAIGR
ncbi:methyltransferase domain-containing protein [Methylosinus sp. H3A]|uniref:methyltransferase domain-containing protein n=1 Tax=Methylosinus sp. H3A TaxID=2785786 RepID=UPI0018C24ECE|nr:methyltransferase domain-containing protein [Methylosinus sp. H3A]MBG0812477.1 methyltransferase domain-containing protein [Methylosinus sp. H3A]